MSVLLAFKMHHEKCKISNDLIQKVFILNQFPFPEIMTYFFC